MSMPLSRRALLLGSAPLAPGATVPDGYRLLDPPFRAGSQQYPVYVRGSGPGVILLQELPGLTRHDLACGRRLADAGPFTVYVPLLFGSVNQDNSFLGYLQSCVGPPLHCLADSKPHRVTPWLAALSRHVSQLQGGPGVGVIGMCLTGALPLALLSEPAVIAPVLSQPSLPFFKKTHLGITPDELKAARGRKDHPPVLYLRFECDSISPPERLKNMQDSQTGLGAERVIVHEVPCGSHRITGHRDHAILSAAYHDEAESPTRKAFEHIVQFLRERLSSRAAGAS